MFHNHFSGSVSRMWHNSPFLFGPESTEAVSVCRVLMVTVMVLILKSSTSICKHNCPSTESTILVTPLTGAQTGQA